MLVSRMQLENIKLMDDPEVSFGGTSYIDETADNFADEEFTGEDENWSKYDCISLKKLNDALVNCGILPIKKQEVVF